MVMYILTFLIYIEAKLPMYRSEASNIQKQGKTRETGLAMVSCYGYEI